MAQPKVLITANGIRGVEILGSENVPTETAMNLRQRAADGILPYIVIVRNTGSLPITGLDIRYEIITNNDTVVNNFFYGSPTDFSDPASPPIIAPGRTATFSPSHAVNQQVNWDGLSLSDREVMEIGRRADVFRQADKIRISVDSVIRSDGRMLAPTDLEPIACFSNKYGDTRNSEISCSRSSQRASQMPALCLG